MIVRPMLYSPPLRPPENPKPKPKVMEATAGPEPEQGPPRNRLRRRSKAPPPPRSQTVPNLFSGGARGAASSAGGSTARADDRPLTGSSGRRSNEASLIARSESPTPAAGHRKKKKHNFPWRSKDKERNESQVFIPPAVPDVPISPKAAKLLGEKEYVHLTELPDEKKLSPKAAKLLGLPEEELYDPKMWLRQEEEENAQEDPYTGAPVEYPHKKQTRFREHDLDDTDPPHAAPTLKSRFLSWKDGSKKSTNKAGLFDGSRPETKRSISDEKATTRHIFEEYNGEVGYSSDGEIEKRRRPVHGHTFGYSGPLAPNTQKSKKQAGKQGPTGSRGRRKRLPKPLDTMTTITEASSVSGGSPTPKFQHSSAELVGISEDDAKHQLQDALPSIFTFTGSHFSKSIEPPYLRRRSVSDPRLPQYQLPKEMLASSESEDEEDVDEQDHKTEPLYRSDTEPLLSRHNKVPEMIQIRSPLQSVEARLLDDMERSALPKDLDPGYEDLLRSLAAHTKLQERQTEKQHMDDVHDKLKASHESLKREFEIKKKGYSMGTGGIPVPTEFVVEHLDEDEENLAGLITFYEDATDDEDTYWNQNDENHQFEFGTHEIPRIYEAVEVRMRSVKDVKKVDMSETVQFSEARRVSLQSPKVILRQNKPELCTIVNAGNGAQRTRNAFSSTPSPAARKKSPEVAAQQTLGTSSSDMPLSGSYNPALRADMRKESAPAPPPKDDVDSSLPKPKHYCLVSNHVFQPINLRTVPDEALINGVRPFLKTSHGVRQQVDVGVRCESCNKYVDEELWLCSVPVCQLAVCYACAHPEEELKNKGNIIGGHFNRFEKYTEGDKRH
ncbi:hypothetical protein BDV96DRAFT_174906 [Lophiotrema nucula]|uniref:Uncharacterized protein n=1 Tax=Lophiotrema nucula TaxID=690887 RepID=A0A6A5YZV4_9PLEO|nr:hypothetical protein BDV96DRAFT_174906 [Lophiotrema nucula]